MSTALSSSSPSPLCHGGSYREGVWTIAWRKTSPRAMDSAHVTVCKRVCPDFLTIRLPVASQGGLKRNALGGVFLVSPSALCGSPVLTQGKSGLPVPPNDAALVHHFGSYSQASHLVSVLPADIASKVCQGG